MENQSSQEQTRTKGKKPQNGTMSFIDHLDELRRRLIRYFIVLALCILATYGFRREILDLIRKPVDAPLKKYTASQQVNPTRPDIPLSSLNSYNCSCTELPIPEAAVPPKASTEAEVATEAATDTKQQTEKDMTEQVTEIAESAGSWIESIENSINDFVIYFEVAVGKDPSPVFETEKYKMMSSQAARSANSFQPMPGHLALNCQCSLATDEAANVGPHSSMVFIGLPELFFAQMKVAIFAGFFLSFPYMLIQIWGFVGPALYRGEKKVFWIFAISSYFFFIGGALFGYFVVFPYGFDFFLSLTQMGEIMPSLSVGEYLGFAVKLLLAFGFIFELPLATFILARMGIVTPEIMIKHARVAILVVFILSAVLTPPDPFTMVLMAGPLLVLYIISIGVCYVGVNRQRAALRAQGVDPDEFKEDIE